jgi:hypothetical protein
MSNQDNANSAQQPELVIYPDEYELIGSKKLVLLSKGARLPTIQTSALC